MSNRQENRIPLVFNDECERKYWEHITALMAAQPFVQRVSAELSVEVGAPAIEALADYLVVSRRERSAKLLSEAEKAEVKERVAAILDKQRKRGGR